MKRLQCLYRPNENKEYPWALKHPKVKSALALFKTRQEATDWYLSLHLECVYWFQNDKQIWAGQVISGREENGEFEHEVVVDNFDGAISFEDTCREFHINPSTWKRDENEEKRRVARIQDFKLLKDPEKYFPVEDIKRPVRKSKKDIEIAELKARISEILLLLSKSSKDYSKEIQELNDKLNDTSSDKSELLKRLAELQAEVMKENQQPVEVVEKEPEVVEVEKIVEKIVYVEKEGDNEVKVDYHNVANYELSDQIDALALYSEKIQEISDNLTNSKTNNEDLAEIKANINTVNIHYSKLQKSLSKNHETQKRTIETLLSNLKARSLALIEKLELDENAKNTPTTKAYFRDNFTKDNVSVAEGTSFVHLNQQHVGFVEKDKYKYSVDKSAKLRKQKVVILESGKEVIVEKEVIRESSKVSSILWWILSPLLLISALVLIGLLIYVGIHLSK
ncbi:MAG3090 family protein [Mycoplasmopsis pullorum]|uniref:Uncharacterized protein n=3 Tax=Mycoplasmopsis pullorum TaxID=48003 RepID=A0A1L4FRB3_9BACT|nr:hypothetical protein [Mycoplasmopsis pullorum]APJ38141.1 hypothetical protein BLA55_00325 [Mycoplasmopsis pullorum]